MANRITSYYSEDISTSLQQQKIELLQFQKALKSEKNKQQKQSAYWFIKGLNHRNLAALYHESGERANAGTQTDLKNSAYRKALQLDHKTPHRLSAVIYSTMKYGLPQDLKITATQGEISQGGKGDNDSYYWYLHWSNIDQLQKAGREDEAKAAYKKMQHELKNSDMDMSIYQTMSQQIEKETLKINDRPSATNKTRKKPQKPEKNNSPSKPVLDKKYIIIYAISTISVLALIIVTVIEIKKKQKKR